MLKQVDTVQKTSTGLIISHSEGKRDTKKNQLEKASLQSLPSPLSHRHHLEERGLVLTKLSRQILRNNQPTSEVFLDWKLETKSASKQHNSIVSNLVDSTSACSSPFLPPSLNHK